MSKEVTMEVREDKTAIDFASLEAPDAEGEEMVIEELEVDSDGRIVDKPAEEVNKDDVKREVEVTSDKTETTAVEDKAVTIPPEITEDPKEKELTELRALAREQRRQLAVLGQKVDRMDKVQQGDVGDTANTEPGELEKLHAEVQTVQKERATFLSEVKALMEVNPKFEDIDTVVTPRRISDIVEAAAEALAPKYSRDVESMSLIIERQIWSMANPYKYLYELIKENHQDFAKKEVTTKTDNTPGTADMTKTTETERHPASKVTTVKKAVETPTAIATISSGSENNGGWTSARIDSMPELELSQVPRDIYKRYLAGELP